MARSSHLDSETAPISVARFQLWVERLVRIGTEIRDTRCELASAAVICGDKPKVVSSDPPRVVRMKEALAALLRQRRAVHREMARVGARLADEQTWEILVPGGPVEGACLSWILGERTIGYYRESDSPASRRHRLPGVDPDAVDPIRH